MEKERLTIGVDKVTVEYEFLNESSTDVTTEILFPLSPYNFSTFISPRTGEPVRDFHVWVDGKQVKYQTQTEALAGDVDGSAILRRLGVDVLEFGHFDDEHTDFEKLSPTQRQELVRQGLYDKDGLPLWRIAITHHWRQTFPTHKVVRIRHEYEPTTGMEHWTADSLQRKGQYQAHFPVDFCIDAPLLRTLEKAVPNDNGFAEGYVEPTWVDYILTTANTWKTPIKDFELIILRPKPEGHGRWFVSLCWPGKLETRDANTFVAREKNFVPRKELRVMFVQVGK